MKGGIFFATIVVFLVCFYLENCLVNSASANITTVKPTTTPAVKDTCGDHNGSCDKCVAFPGAKCYYCYTTNECSVYPAKEIFPTKYCDLSEARWGVCFLNFEALIISMGVIAGVLILAFIICCYCCCCRRSGSNRAKYANEDAKFERKKTERKMHHEQKKAERKAKNDEIRRKYGLMADDEGTYHKLDDSAVV